MVMYKIERIEGVEKIVVVSDKLIIMKFNFNENIIMLMVSFEFLVFNLWWLSIFFLLIIIFFFLLLRGYFIWLLYSYISILGYLFIG